jgi:carboxylesterase type B
MDEFSYFLCPKRINITENELNIEIIQLFGEEKGKRIINFYNNFNYQNNLRKFSDILTDYFFKCPNIQYASLLSKNVPLYFYSFEYFSDFSNSCLNVAHVHELPYLFDNVAKYFFNDYKFNQNELLFGKKFKNLWFNFSNNHFLHFQRFNSSLLNYLKIHNRNFSFHDNFNRIFCNFWNNF